MGKFEHIYKDKWKKLPHCSCFLRYIDNLKKVRPILSGERTGLMNFDLLAVSHPFRFGVNF